MNDQSTLPVDILPRESSEFTDTETGVEEGPNDQALVDGLARVSEIGRLILGQRLSFVLVGHVSQFTLEGDRVTPSFCGQL